MNIIKEAEKLYGLLHLENRVVGVKFVYSEEEFDRYDGRLCDRPMAYCCAVRAATRGNSVKLTKETGGCAGSNKSIGFCLPPEGFYNGKDGVKLGLYGSEKVAAEVSVQVPIMPMDTYGIIVKPLELFETEPQVVLVVCNPREMMRVMQGYTYVFGLAKGLSFSGNRAVCVESTVTPIMTGEINVSVLCGGTRFRAGWHDYEMMVGIPISKLEGVVEGILQTVNPMEMDPRKHEIEENLRRSGNLGDLEIIYGKTYFKNWESR